MLKKRVIMNVLIIIATVLEKITIDIIPAEYVVVITAALNSIATILKKENR